MDDVFRARHVREIGVENVMIETDSPHTASSRPHSMQTARERLAHLTDEEQCVVLQGNARRVFDRAGQMTVADPGERTPLPSKRGQSCPVLRLLHSPVLVEPT